MNNQFKNWEHYELARNDFTRRTEKLCIFRRFMGLGVILPLFAFAVTFIFSAILFLTGKASFDVVGADIYFAMGSTLSIVGILLIGWRDIEIPTIQAELKSCEILVASCRTVIDHFDNRLPNETVWKDRKLELIDTYEKASKRKKALRNTEFLTRHTGRIGSIISVIGILVLAFSYAESSQPIAIGLPCLY